MSDAEQREKLSLNTSGKEEPTEPDHQVNTEDSSQAATSSDIRSVEDPGVKTSPVKELEPSPPKKKATRKDLPAVNSLSEFLDRFIENKGKILSQDKKVFDRLDRNLTEDHKVRLVRLFLEKDADLKYCLILSEFLLVGSRESSIHMQALDFIERVISGYSLFEKIKNDSVFQVWLPRSCDGSDKLSFFESQFRNLKAIDEKGKEKHFTDSQIATLLCICAVWLYFKKESDFFTLTRYLSQSAFSTDGQRGDLIERQAFAFATSMISSNKKKQFSYFLQMVSETERSLSQQLRAKSVESNRKTSEIISLTIQNGDILEKNNLLEAKVGTLTSHIQTLENKIALHQEKARHRDTHHEDSKDELRIKLKNVLEGELKDVLEKAKKAHEKGKYSIVEYQIDDALDILLRELKGMDSYG